MKKETSKNVMSCVAKIVNLIPIMHHPAPFCIATNWCSGFVCKEGPTSKSSEDERF